MKRFLIILIAFSLVIGILPASGIVVQAGAGEKFTDVPSGHWAEQDIYKLKELKITDGRGDGTFGLDHLVTRAEFVTFLIKMLSIDIDKGQAETGFADVKKTDWHWGYINAAIKNQIISENEYKDRMFEPDKSITREEMAVMIVRALGYDYLARLLESELKPFEDVTKNKGYIAIAKDLGVINGKSANKYFPMDYALRQEAAAMLVRMHNILNNKIETLHGFYAIRSYPQISNMKVFDTVGFGWSRLEYNTVEAQVEVATEIKTGEDYWVPEGFEIPIQEAEKNQIKKYIMVFATNDEKIEIKGKKQGLVSFLLSDEKSIQRVNRDIISLATLGLEKDGKKAVFGGVVIDFEGLRNEGNDKERFSYFLQRLKQGLNEANKELIVAVPPKRQEGQPYFDGYDYKAIGQAADKVILMAHDYEPKRLTEEEKKSFTGTIPSLAPIKDVYYALRYALDKDNGIPADKLLLQINFNSILWEFKDGKVINEFPVHLDYGAVNKWLNDASIIDKQLHYSNTVQAPYFTFIERDTGIKKIAWFEDERSVQAKIKLARLFGAKGISIWRMGLVPDFEDEPGQPSHFLNVWPILNGDDK